MSQACLSVRKHCFAGRIGQGFVQYTPSCRIYPKRLSRLLDSLVLMVRLTGSFWPSPHPHDQHSESRDKRNNKISGYPINVMRGAQGVDADVILAVNGFLELRLPIIGHADGHGPDFHAVIRG